MLFRAGDFNKLTEKYFLYFSRISVRGYIDFRDLGKVNKVPDKALSSLREELTY
ncbi:MAG: hypothetical protein LBH34_01930 [Prevotellaceae bacterium]|jgi:hypothetical protein|nr:hypothetical protein [Prevotellaceae bacterium]